MSISGYGAVIALAMLEGALVALPRADALEPLRRLRSPVWAALLPGSILLGTFGPLALPSMAPALVVLARIVTPLLAAVAVVAVARGSRQALLIVALALALVAAFISGWAGQLSASVLTALGCLALGSAVVRLIPPGWILIGILVMAAADLALLTSGVGHSAGVIMADATANVHGPVFDQAGVGGVSIDYPDLVLAGMLGVLAAGRNHQWTAAVLVAMIAAVFGMVLPIGSGLPATVPIALTFVLLECARLAQRRRVPGIPAAASAT
ncbi:MAG: hypothetical protein JOZ98_20040 [Solirubrobacterales bacterium]|nr:hypothetical protein [Solirubrobacterales bacterium]MBV9800987.1 hypothetical protein [Solirubrobacterales bacterium]